MIKALAREKRKQYEITGYRISLSNIKKLCKQEGIGSIEYTKFKGIRGAYFNDDCGITIVIKKDLPVPQKIFTIIHELKHHLLDRGIPKFACTNRNENTEIEIGAEIFAVEFIFPDKD